MLLLASFPPYPAASHDPAQWMDKLTRVAQRSRESSSQERTVCSSRTILISSVLLAYQKLLNWEPLLELVRVETVNKQHVYSTREMVQLHLLVRLHGPKVSGRSLDGV